MNGNLNPDQFLPFADDAAEAMAAGWSMEEAHLPTFKPEGEDTRPEGMFSSHMARWAEKNRRRRHYDTSDSDDDLYGYEDT